MNDGIIVWHLLAFDIASAVLGARVSGCSNDQAYQKAVVKLQVAQLS